MQENEMSWILDRQQTIRYLGYQKGQPDEIMLNEIRECEERFLTIVNPGFYYEVYDLVRKDEKLFTKDLEFELIGTNIQRHLAACSQVAFVCLTLSKQVDDLIEQAQRENMLHAFILDAIANASVEQVRKQAEKTIAAECHTNVNWLFGIGYGDVPLTLQHPFLEKIHAREHLGVYANDKSILIPLKSVTGFLGLLPDETNQEDCKQRNCVSCNHNSNCLYQRTDGVL